MFSQAVHEMWHFSVNDRCAVTSSALRLRCNGLIDGLAGGLPLLAAGVAWIGTSGRAGTAGMAGTAGTAAKGSVLSDSSESAVAVVPGRTRS